MGMVLQVECEKRQRVRFPWLYTLFVLQTDSSIMTAPVVPDSAALFGAFHWAELCCLHLLATGVAFVRTLLLPLEDGVLGFVVVGANHWSLFLLCESGREKSTVQSATCLIQ